MKPATQITASQSEEVYQYVGDGAGVPGLPHEISALQAREMGLIDLLDAAIENGTYQLKAEV